MSKYQSAPVSTDRMPGGIPYIIGNEAAERFSFYGMKTILAVFMTKYLHLMGDSAGTPMNEAVANEKVHAFNAAVYFTPILGALLCDAVLGKYRTIIWLSLVYCLGHAALAFMGTAGQAALWLLAGLFLISVGSGGIKPCVSAHVGDQFGRQNSFLLPRIFNYFYFSINFGAFLSTLLTPWLLQWFGPHWAFGVPGVLMALATVVFWMGRGKFVHIPARGQAFISEVFSRDGLAAIGKLSIIYLFVAMFWALFDQTGSSWIFQAQDMDRNWAGVEWLESQIQAVNPVLILLFIPLFTFVVYPRLDRVFPLTPLRKISIGLFVMVGAFGLVSLIQEWIDAGERPSIGWQIVAYALITASEIMVSIVCLEFSYTQAPKKMKSVIMALFLFSVSLGNAFTGLVNRFIQIPAPFHSADAAFESLNIHGELRQEGSKIIHAGFDGAFSTADDLEAIYENKVRQSVAFAGRDTLEQAADRIEAAAAANGGTLPLTAAGGALVGDLVDPWGQPIRYRLMSSRQFRVSSDGPDKNPQTQWDVGFIVDKSVAAPSAKGLLDIVFGFLLPDQPWTEKRLAELAALQAGAGAAETPVEASAFSRRGFAGGQNSLEGAAYFWFFTWLMLATAVLFVIVAWFYKPKTYLQDAVEDAGPDARS